LNNLEKTITFIVEIEQLKGVLRKTKPVGLDRYENSAEHSWHVCLSALLLKEYANEVVDIDKVIKMLLIHDLGEIDAGDTVFYHANRPDVKEAEEIGIKRILETLPTELADNYFQLWQEFESGKTAESKFARAVDRIPPLLHNIHWQGHSWKKFNISKEKVLTLNSQIIATGSTSLWKIMETKLEDAFMQSTIYPQKNVKNGGDG